MEQPYWIVWHWLVAQLSISKLDLKGHEAFLWIFPYWKLKGFVFRHQTQRSMNPAHINTQIHLHPHLKIVS